MTVSPVLLLCDTDARTPFAEQFVEQHCGTPVALLLDLHPALHHEHLADTVRELAAVPGVARMRWIRASPAGEALLSDGVRAVLAGFTMRTSELGGEPLICLLHEATSTVLVTVHPGDTGGAGINQRTLHLGEVVAQALRHHCEAGGYDQSPVLPDPQVALCCSGCARLAGAGREAEALDLVAGGACAQVNVHTGEVCPGVLEDVTVLVARRGSAAMR